MAHQDKPWKVGLSFPYTGEEAHFQGSAFKLKCAKAGGKDGIKPSTSDSISINIRQGATAVLHVRGRENKE